eukprot:TRINITY_DN5093_c0_g1_i1.p1 TRINITY_DN5093_c0_g1~~TRINITY_DN5093_c0_g1_i1.p1  ORF type:complete len:437 (-),score=111.21 TRINITY_DN5093_c0_g1_i1:30-1340(-)
MKAVVCLPVIFLLLEICCLAEARKAPSDGRRLNVEHPLTLTALFNPTKACVTVSPNSHENTTILIISSEFAGSVGLEISGDLSIVNDGNSFITQNISQGDNPVKIPVRVPGDEFGSTGKSVFFTVMITSVHGGSVDPAGQKADVEIKILPANQFIASEDSDLNGVQSVDAASSSAAASSGTGTLGVNQILTWVGVSVGSLIFLALLIYALIRIRNAIVLSRQKSEGKPQVHHPTNFNVSKSLSPSRKNTQISSQAENRRSKTPPPKHGHKKNASLYGANAVENSNSGSTLKTLFSRPSKSSANADDIDVAVVPPLPPAPVLPNLPPSLGTAINFEDNEMTTVQIASGSEPSSPAPRSNNGRTSPAPSRFESKGQPRAGGGKLEFGLRITTQQFAKPRQFSMKNLPSVTVSAPSDERIPPMTEELVQEDSNNSKSDD